MNLYYIGCTFGLYNNWDALLLSFNSGSILITFDVQGDHDAIEAALLEDLSSGNIQLSFNGHILTPDNYLIVDGKEVTPVSNGYKYAYLLSVKEQKYNQGFYSLCTFNMAVKYNSL